jgi:hypothetical protein
MNRRNLIVLPFFAFFSLSFLAGQTAKPTFNQYHKPDEIAGLLQSYTARFPQMAKILSLGKSYGKADIPMIRIAGQPKGSVDPDARPAVFVSANAEGLHHIGTEAALMLADNLLTKYGQDKAVTSFLDARTVFVVPLLNPDAARAYFAPAKSERSANSRPVDNDNDGKADEDGPDDLNKDGVITQMRVKDPEGRWIPDPKEPRLMRLADPKKGEKGIYKVYTEGLDNDGDGEYNEDAEGGVDINRNFPHDFEYGVKSAGLYPVSESETEAVVKFLVSHPSVALILNFSTENTILNMQQTGQAKPGGDKIKVPAYIAPQLGLDPNTEYTPKEIADLLKGSPMVGGMDITEEMVLQFFGGGPAMALDQNDMPIFEAVQKDYKDALKAAKLDYLEKKAKSVGKGSFVAYSYYQYGAPVFSVNLWAVPEPKAEEKKPGEEPLSADKLKSMTSDQFLAFGEDKINSFLKEMGAPANFNASMLMGMVRSGQLTPAKMAEMMAQMPKKPGGDGEEHPDTYLIKYSDTALKGKGFVNWTPFKHPTLGDVEIGGFVPYLKVTPPPEEIEKAISFHADFYIKLMGKMADLAIPQAKVKSLGEDLYQVTVYFSNQGWLPTSTGQGRRAMTAWPIRVNLGLSPEQTLFSGRPVENISFLAGSGDTKTLEWTVRGKKGSKLTVKAWAPRLGTLEKTVVLE